MSFNGKICVTGHRPNKLGGFTHDAKHKVYLKALESLDILKPELVYTGMAVGWDQAIADACITLNIPYVAVVPFVGQETAWPPHSQEHYRKQLQVAQSVEILAPAPYRPEKMQRRNEWMVDHADRVLALWNGDHEGGTYNCVRYAMVCGKPIVNAWGLFSGTHDFLTTVTKL